MNKKTIHQIRTEKGLDKISPEEVKDSLDNAKKNRIKNSIIFLENNGYKVIKAKE